MFLLLGREIHNFNLHIYFVTYFLCTTFSESILVGIKNSMMTPQNRRLPQPPGMYAFCFLCPSFYFRMNLRDLSLDFVRKWGCDECWKLSENWCHIIRSWCLIILFYNFQKGQDSRNGMFPGIFFGYMTMTFFWNPE